jgi:hypothetical protein
MGTAEPLLHERQCCAALQSTCSIHKQAYSTKPSALP